MMTTVYIFNNSDDQTQRAIHSSGKTRNLENGTNIKLRTYSLNVQLKSVSKYFQKQSLSDFVDSLYVVCTKQLTLHML